MSDAMDVVRRLFRAVERRDRDAVMACYAEDVEIHEAAVLPYGGTWRGPDTVCVLFRHRAVDPKRGTRFDAPEIGVYQVRDGKVVRSQMFHADSTAVARFLTDAAAVPSTADERPC
jgi:ketosteroid isomerase-like protein